jgi:hypothetical protein
MVWIRALESDEYFQGYGAMKTRNGGLCCIGVAREVHPDIDNSCVDYEEVAHRYDYSEFTQDTLVAMNDSETVSFSGIAKYLRRIWGLENAA